MDAPYLFKRGNVFYFRRPIPKHIQHVWKKKEVVVSLKTRDRETALARYVVEYNKVSAQISCIEAGGTASGVSSFPLDRLLSMFDLRKIQPSVIENQSVENLFKSVAHNVQVVSSWPAVTKAHVDALAATVQSHLSWQQLFDRFNRLDRDHYSAKDDERTKDKRKTPKSNAIATFETHFPNTNVLTITRKDALEFKDKLIDSMTAGELKADTANKKLMHLRTMIEMVFKADFPENKNPFKDVSIKVHEIGKRKPLSSDDIAIVEQHFAESDASDELKALNFIAMNTGAHQKELVFLTSDDIHLDAAIPYIRIAENKYRDKVKHGGARHRELPLVGKALEWARKFPNGFPTYCKSGGADNLSAASNKHLRALTGKTFYGYRHRIADLLRNSGCNDSLKDSVLGHKTPGMGAHYGEGYTLEKKRDALARALGVIEQKENGDGR